MVSSIKSKLFLVLSIIIAVSVICFSPFFAFCDADKYIRVAIIQNIESANIKISGAYELIDPKKDLILESGEGLNTTVTVYGNGILLAGKSFNYDKLFVKINDSGITSINGRNFRGNIKFIRSEGSKLSIINYIYIEDYIKGVLYHEVSHYWPMDALKAQAIVSRTYAVNQILERKDKDYDVTSDIYSQLYGGRTSERYRTNRAVEETSGRILVYQDKVFPAFFHAVCAGHTEDASRIWNIKIEPLKGVACEFCKGAPHFNWHYVLSLAEIQKKLNGAGFKVGNINNISIRSRNSSGRINELELSSVDNKLILSAKDFRGAIGPNLIRSTNFDIKLIGKEVVFEGVGWGHGVGLCQWGAYFMAKNGYKYDKILEYYYPQAKLSFLPDQ